MLPRFCATVLSRDGPFHSRVRSRMRDWSGNGAHPVSEAACGMQNMDRFVVSSDNGALPLSVKPLAYSPLRSPRTVSTSAFFIGSLISTAYDTFPHVDPASEIWGDIADTS